MRGSSVCRATWRKIEVYADARHHSPGRSTPTAPISGGGGRLRIEQMTCEQNQHRSISASGRAIYRLYVPVDGVWGLSHERGNCLPRSAGNQMLHDPLTNNAACEQGGQQFCGFRTRSIIYHRQFAPFAGAQVHASIPRETTAEITGSQRLEVVHFVPE